MKTDYYKLLQDECNVTLDQQKKYSQSQLNEIYVCLSAKTRQFPTLVPLITNHMQDTIGGSMMPSDIENLVVAIKAKLGF